MQLTAHTHRMYDGSPDQIGKYLTWIDEAGHFFEPRFYAGKKENYSVATFRSVMDDYGNLQVVTHYLPESR